MIFTKIIVFIFCVFILYYLYINFYSKPRIVVSLTTSPQRIHNIKAVLDAISNQTLKPDRIYLNLPKVFKRNNTTFDSKLPYFINDNPLVYVNFCDDIGPATKIIPTVLKEFWPNTYIFSIDDDTYYPKNTLEQFVNAANVFDNSIITGTSFIKNNSIIDNKWFYDIKSSKLPIFYGELVDILEGFSGVLYKRKYFSSSFMNDFYKDLNENSCKFGDDFYLSNLFKKHNIKIVSLNLYINRGKFNNDFVYQFHYGFGKDALHKGGDNKTGVNNTDNYKVCTNYLDNKKELFIDYFKKG